MAPIFVESNGQNRIIVVKGANDRLLPADVDEAHAGARSADCIVLQFEIPLETVYYTIRFARERGIRCILNPAPGQPVDVASLDGLATTSCPTRARPRPSPACRCGSVDEARAAAAHLLERGLGRVIITLGEKGALLAGTDGAEVMPPFAVATKDTTGAGDAFVGSFAVFLGEGLPERDAVARANLYAALSTMNVGTQKSFVTRARFDEEWKARGAAPVAG